MQDGNQRNKIKHSLIPSDCRLSSRYPVKIEGEGGVSNHMRIDPISLYHLLLFPRKEEGTYWGFRPKRRLYALLPPGAQWSRVLHVLSL